MDPDIVLTNGSDADSSGGSKIIATSIDGEDGLVDVTMKDSNRIQEPSSDNSSQSKAAVTTKPAYDSHNRKTQKQMTNFILECLSRNSIAADQSLLRLGRFSALNYRTCSRSATYQQKK